MKSSYKLAISFLMLSLILGLSPAGLATEDLEKQMTQTSREIEKLRDKEHNVMGNLVRTQAEVDKLSADLSKLNNRVGTAEKKMKVIDTQLNKTQSDIQKIRVSIEGHKKVLNSRLVSIYKYGYQSYLEILFQVKNFSEFISRFEMVGNFVHRDLQMIKTLQQQHNLIANKQRQISKYQEELERQKRVYDRLKAQAVKKRRSLRAKASIQQQELNNIMLNREKLEAALDEMEELSRSMESEIRDVQKKSNVTLGSGTYIWPTAIRGKITSLFGSRFHPILKKYRHHTGYDIAVPTGTPILAADNGVVIFSGNKGGYGKTVMIDHGLGYSSVYGHNSVLLVSTGQHVNKGQRIALAGSTGLSTGPHCHFEIRKNGVPQDPGKYL
ncbi:MAG TPA: peptidoglycan DD-metalloendopeptidase family protein [Bacillota bacterium]